MKKRFHIEKGYLVIFTLMAIFVTTFIVQLHFQKMNMDRAYEIAKINAELIKLGFGYSLVPYQVDMSSFNFIYTGLAAALTIAIPAQAAKKKQNNKDEHAMNMIEKLELDPELKHSVPSIMQSYLQTTIIN